jgi:hypothetical protein
VPDTARAKSSRPAAAGDFLSSSRKRRPHFLSHERETNKAVEVAVRQFAAERTWPALSPLARTMLCFRLEFAASLAKLLGEQPAPWTDSAESQKDEDRLGWLMLFAWEQEGFPTLHENLARLIPAREDSGD